MSSHPSPATARPWRITAAVLAVLLVLVLAGGAWALWRPLSEHDTARLTARATVESVRSELTPDPDVLPDDALARQLDALGPAATPAQQRRLDEQGGQWNPPADLADAADRMARLSAAAPDEELAGNTASVAASWWAAQQSLGTKTPAQAPDSLLDTAGVTSGEGAGPAAGGPGDSGRGTSPGAVPSGSSGGSGPVPASPGATSSTQDADSPAGTETPCREDLLAATTALDRSAFTAEAATAVMTDGPAQDTVTTVADDVRATLSQPRVEPLLACEPSPVAARHDLPRDLAEEPARSVGQTQQETARTLLAAAASSPSEDRVWLLTALRDTVRTAQALAPQEPVPALPAAP
ncbi:hypothetical protein CYJ75_09690 [Kocuria rhizophila]|uniref:hypothetical protein n=1 Tax=Kocuria rhizophila TaxID=72000 RepID=UPI000C7AD86D|nr:hypothetical protein [Kocuria rhizophila]PKZ37466.1 hypothetical protein CYJ75_09690 [Kocuria rhizophila]